MSVTQKEYSKLVKKASPNSKLFPDILRAFLIGGLICLISQGFMELYEYIGLNKDEVKLAVPSSIIVLTAFLTAIGIYDNIAAYAGAGALVPISGFANSVVAPALEYKSEGFVLGTGVKIFTIAGPVIVFGTATAVIYGIIYCIFM